MAHAEPEPVEAKPVAAEADVSKIPVRSDLPAGHWLAGKRAARVVWSGETDQVVVGDKLVAVRDAVELAAAEAEPVEEKPIEEPGEVVPRGR